MKLTYIYHSCYVLEADGFAIVFDYYRDSGESPVEGYIHDEVLKRKGRLYVFSSHSHPDHFNRDILSWKQEKTDIIYLLSADILQEGKAPKEAAVYLDKGDTYEDGTIYVKAFGSTDIGVSFLLETGGKRLFHAGDLNNWHWVDESTTQEVEEAESAYLSELELIAKTTDHLDLAMFPVDPRLGSQYMRGAEQFISRIQTDILAPMHFGRAYDKVAAFKDFAEKQNCKLLDLTRKGQQVDI